MPVNLNADLLDKLKDKDFLSSKSKDERDTLLNAILMVDATDEDAFRQAVAGQKDVLDYSQHAKAWVNSHSRLTKAIFTVNEADFYSEAAFLDFNEYPTFIEIQQAAAAQRVKLNLNVGTDTDVLVAILGHNTEACRRYLTEKIAPEINNSPGWTKIIAGPKPVAEDKDNPEYVLTDEAIDEIKQLAAAYRIQKALDGASLKQLTALETAKNSGKDAFFDSIKKDFDVDIPSDSRDMELVWEIISPKVTASLNTDKMAKTTKFISKELSNTDIDGLGAYVNEEDPKALVEHLVKKMGSESDFTPSEADSKSIRDQVRIRHLELLLKSTDVDSTEALAAKTPEELKGKLKELFPEQTYIEQVTITADTQKLFNAAMKHKFSTNVIEAINKQQSLSDIDLLINIDKAGDSVALKAVLTSIAVKSAPHIIDDDMPEIKKAARAQRFAIQVEAYSELAPRFSSALVQMFNGLDQAQQRKMLEAHNSLLPTLLNANNLSEMKLLLKDKLGKDIEDKFLTPILEHNKVNALFKSIYNSKIVTVLREIYPPIKLIQAHVDGINKILLDIKDSSLADDAAYSKMVKEIEVIVGANTGAFYSAFGLKEDGSGLSTSSIRNDINKQSTNNEELAQASKSTEISPHLLSVLLQIEKQKPITKDEITKIQAMFIGSANLGQFNQSLRADGSFDMDTKRRFALYRLTPNLFKAIKVDLEAIKADLEAIAFSKGEPAAVANVQKELQELQKNNGAFDEYKNKVAFILNIRDEHIYSPLFRTNILDMRAKYSELSEQCNVVIEQLNHNKQRITDYLANLPEDSTRADVVKLRTDLTTELGSINSRLDYFVGTTQARLSGEDGILKAIDDSFASKAFTYQIDGINTYIIKKKELTGEGSKPKKSESTPIAAIDLSGNKGVSGDPFILEKTPNKDEVRCFDVTHTASNKVETTGRFIHEIVDKNAMTVTHKGGHSVTKNNPGRFEIMQFPQKEGDKPDTKAHIEAKVNFAMVMATQALSALDSPPTKDRPIVLRGKSEEELKYIWTALMILGEKNPRLKFGSDAVHVSSIKFNPENEKGRLWGYSANSLYNTAFKEHRAHVDFKVKDSAKHSENVFDSKDKRPEVRTASEFFKQELNSTKKEVDQRRAKSTAKGPEGPEGPSI